MSETAYWVWLQCALGEGAAVQPLLEEFGSAKAVYDANIMEWRMTPALTKYQVQHLESTPLSAADKVLSTCKQQGWQILHYDHPDYPRLLRDLPDPPLVLYVDGTVPDWNRQLTLGIVGTRQASAYAVQVCDIMAKGVAGAGALVVSGGALGIDSTAHKGAMLAGGTTVAVLGCGLGTRYLMQNEPLRAEIRSHGALVTEFRPFTPAGKHTFPLRNRLISGMSEGLLVVEAGSHSGSLITARCALEQGRDVYAVPGSVLSTDFAGTNDLINDGAYVVTQPVQLLSGYAERYHLDLNRVPSVQQLLAAEQDPGANLPQTSKEYDFERLEEGRQRLKKRRENQALLTAAESAVLAALPEVFTPVDQVAAKAGTDQAGTAGSGGERPRQPLSEEITARERKDIEQMSKLVIVESPAKAKNIKGYLGKGYDVVASMGHVRDLPAARLSVDIAHDFAPKYAVIAGKENFVKDLKKKAQAADYVYLATDPDREGEAISWHLATLLGLDMNEKNRVTFNEITKHGVLTGMEHPRAIDIDFVNAQQARRILDRLIGYKLSPFISQKIRRGLSAGRVQSVALRLVVDREEEIRAFKPEEYWSIDAKFTNPPERKSFAAALAGKVDDKAKIKITSKEESDKILSDLEGAEYIVQSVKKGTRKKSPTPPFITSTLQQEASRRLSFQAKRTMKAAQELYEGVEVAGHGTLGLITYMRTDSLRISEEARAAGNAFITETYGEKYLPKKPRYFKSKSNIQDGHEAIRPTTPSITPEMVKGSVTTDQYKIYKLVWERFIASLMENCLQETMKIEIVANGYVFNATGYTVKFDGFTVLYEEKGDDGKTEGAAPLPPVKAGDKLRLKNILGNQHFTQPPARYTEASLTKALEENGVGRPSTYVTITSTIVGREYVKREGKQFVPTELGEAVTKLLEERMPNIVDVKYTSKMEADLDKIDSGDRDYIDMIRHYYEDFEAPLEKAKKEMQGVKIKLKEEETDVVCEKCGRNMVIKVGRYSKFLACPGYPECKNTKPLVFKTKAKCPVCGADVIEKKTRRGTSFYGCSAYPNCNFMTWDVPTDEVCPQCGKSLFKKRGNVLVCLDEKCGFSKPAPKKKKEQAEE